MPQLTVLYITLAASFLAQFYVSFVIWHYTCCISLVSQPFPLLEGIMGKGGKNVKRGTLYGKLQECHISSPFTFPFPLFPRIRNITDKLKVGFAHDRVLEGS